MKSNNPIPKYNIGDTVFQIRSTLLPGSNSKFIKVVHKGKISSIRLYPNEALYTVEFNGNQDECPDCYSWHEISGDVLFITASEAQELLNEQVAKEEAHKAEELKLREEKQKKLQWAEIAQLELELEELKKKYL